MRNYISDRVSETATSLKRAPTCKWLTTLCFTWRDLGTYTSRQEHHQHDGPHHSAYASTKLIQALWNFASKLTPPSSRTMQTRKRLFGPGPIDNRATSSRTSVSVLCCLCRASAAFVACSRVRILDEFSHCKRQILRWPGNVGPASFDSDTS